MPGWAFRSWEVVPVCGPGQRGGVPSGMAFGESMAPGSAVEALGMIGAGFAWLAQADVASLPAVVLAECLRELERVGR